MHKHRQSDPALYGDLELSNQVDSLIIIDRSVDWVTPMCTQLTFEGLLDEYVGVKNGEFNGLWQRGKSLILLRSQHTSR